MNNSQNSSNWKVFLPLAFAGVMVVGMLLGFKFYETLNRNAHKGLGNSYAGTETIDEVFNFIRAKYVDTLDNNELAESVIKETLQELDPHSSFIPADELEATNEQLEGNFDGIGIQFSIVSDTIVVISPITGGPSERLGVLPGDKIIEIQDSMVAGIGLTNQDVMDLLKGKKNTSVRIGIKRQNSPEILDFNIEREKIPLYSLDTGFMLDNEVGFIKLNRFSSTTYDEFGDKVIELKKQGMKKMIIDLRQNPGGYLEASTQIADELIDGKQLLVYTKGNNYRRKDYFSKVMGEFEEGELAVLIDQGSASASEVLAGAIQDLERGIIVGRRSFGKGLVQEQLRLKDGSALRLTVARYYTPLGRSVQKSYEGGTDNYYDELDERFDNGEMYSEDSINLNEKPVFKTKSGKEVYGGGGISPDIFVALDTSEVDRNYLLARSYIPGFIYQHFSRNQTEYLKMKDLEQFKSTFKVGEKMWGEFTTYLDSEKAEVSTKFNNGQLEKASSLMKAFLARQIWQNDGYYAIMLEDDEVLLEARKALSDKFYYQDALR